MNAGAGLAIVLGIALLGADSPLQWLMFAFSGALLAALLEGLISGLSLLNPDIYDHLRFWQSGSLDIRDFSVLRTLCPSLNLSQGLGDDFTLKMGISRVYKAPSLYQTNPNYLAV